MDAPEVNIGRDTGESSRADEGANLERGSVGKGKHVEVVVGDGRNQLAEVRVGEVKVRMDRGKLMNDRRSVK